MARSETAVALKEELAALAANLPFRVIELPIFVTPGYEPEKIRQPRRYIEVDSNMQSVGRFLMERGIVELLKPEQTMALFTEMHWSGWRIKQLGAQELDGIRAVREALTEARRMMSRVEGAEEELFIANRRMIVNCVKPYFWVGQVWLSDFLQEGSKALANSIRKFDFTRGVPFYSYSQTAVQNRMRNYFRDHVRSGAFTVRPNREMQLVQGIIETWKRDYREEPTDETVAKIAELTPDRVRRVRSFLKQWSHLPPPPVSLDAEINEDGTNRYELIEDPSSVDISHNAEAAEIWTLMEQLPERSRYIMKLRFVEGRTLEETGELLKLTRARIKQIQDAAVKKIRQMLHEKQDRD